MTIGERLEKKFKTLFLVAGLMLRHQREIVENALAEAVWFQSKLTVSAKADIKISGF